MVMKEAAAYRKKHYKHVENGIRGDNPEEEETMKHTRLGYILMLVSALVLALIPGLVSAVAETGADGAVSGAPVTPAEPVVTEGGFSFRDGITFGMTAEEIKAAEARNTQTSDDSWRSMDLNGWYVFGTATNLPVGDFEAPSLYFAAEGKMQAASYDFQHHASDDVFSGVRSMLSSQYGESKLADSADLAALMDCFSPGFYTAEDIRDGAAWQAEGAEIYQFWYNSDSFVVFCINPAYDFTQPLAAQEEPAA